MTLIIVFYALCLASFHACIVRILLYFISLFTCGNDLIRTTLLRSAFLVGNNLQNGI